MERSRTPIVGFLRPALVGLATVILVATACTSSGSQTTPAAQKREITIVQGADAETLDQQGTAVRATLNIVDGFAQALTKVTYSDKDEPKIEPVLATSWKTLSDTVWQFKLREGVRFSNGEPFDADSVKFSLDRLTNAGYTSTQKKYVANFSGIEIVDKHTVNFIAKTATPLPPLDLTQFYMVPPKYAQEVGPQTFAVKPVGTGPFKVVEWVKSDHITLEANADYWGGKPKLDKITLKPVPEAATRSAAIETGQADIVTPIQVPDVARLRQLKGFHVDDAISARILFFTLDQAKDPIMQNLKVRQALNYAVDKEAIVKGIYQGNATVLQGQGLTPSYFGFNPSLKPYPFDPARAKQLLAEAGHPNGFEMVLWSPRGAYSGDYETAQAVAGQLTNVGVRATVKPVEFGVYIKDWQAKTLTPALLAGFATNGDADAMFDVFRTGGVFSYTSVAEFDRLVQQERSTLDVEKRLLLLQQAAKVQYDQALAIWLHQLRNFVAVGDRIQGFKLYPNEGFELFNISLK